MPTLHLVFVVNGVEVKMDVSYSERLEAVVEQALQKSRNTSRPASEWELRKEDGSLILDRHKTLGEYGFVDFMKLMLNLKVGAGGAASFAS